MNGLNRVFIAGFLGVTPELKWSKKSKPYCHLKIATQKSRKNQNDEIVQNTQWHSITVWGKKAETCCSYLKTGSAVAIEGTIDNYQATSANGESLWRTGITAYQVHFMSRSNAQQKEAG
jgi:single-strand DNA-binding protein